MTGPAPKIKPQGELGDLIYMSLADVLHTIVDHLHVREESTLVDLHKAVEDATGAPAEEAPQSDEDGEHDES